MARGSSNTQNTTLIHRVWCARLSHAAAVESHLQILCVNPWRCSADRRAAAVHPAVFCQSGDDYMAPPALQFARPAAQKRLGPKSPEWLLSGSDCRIVHFRFVSMEPDILVGRSDFRGLREVREGLLPGNTLDYPKPARRQYPVSLHCGSRFRSTPEVQISMPAFDKVDRLQSRCVKVLYEDAPRRRL